MNYLTRCVLIKLAVVVTFLFSGVLFGEPVSKEYSRQAAESFLQIQRSVPVKAVSKDGEQRYLEQVAVGYEISDVREIKDSRDKVLAYVQELEPEGFIITSADDNVRPILGYSFKGRFPFEDTKNNVLRHLVQWDVTARLKALSSSTEEAKSVALADHDVWDRYVSADEVLAPADNGATQWGPWISTEWEQRSRYNDSCPQDPKYNWMGPLAPRSVVGCVATAMAQIINYWKYPSSATFTLDSDRYESKGKHGTFWIPDTSDQYDYPDFAELNSALQTIEYDENEEEEAYLCFAVGIKLGMGYSSSGSGTISRTFTYLDEFRYGSAVRGRGGWIENRDEVIRNMRYGWPVQVSLVSSTGELVGHSVIIDGYRENDNFFHITNEIESV